MKTLVINTGSSSIKYQLFLMPEGTVLCTGLIEEIGDDNGKITHKRLSNGSPEVYSEAMPIPDHQTGMQKLAELLSDKDFGVIEAPDDIDLVGHRVVHGGEKFADPTFITGDVIDAIDKLADLAPLHNPSNLIGIRMAEKVFPTAKQIGVFDTAYHQTIPEFAYKYAIPNSLYEKYGIRVYGFHGTSHKYIATKTAEILGKPLHETNLISVHLGNGASITAIRNGRSIDTSLGFTTVGGLVMGTRSGDIDPGIIFYLNEEAGIPMAELKNTLYKESGMKGLTGTNDLRIIQEEAEKGDVKAQKALEIYAYRVKKYIGAYTAILGKTDAVVFTAGVGENSPEIREMSIDGLGQCGVKLDKAANRQAKGTTLISDDASPIKVFVIPTNEELEIANQAFDLVS